MRHLTKLESEVLVAYAREAVRSGEASERLVQAGWRDPDVAGRCKVARPTATRWRQFATDPKLGRLPSGEPGVRLALLLVELGMEAPVALAPAS